MAMLAISVVEVPAFKVVGGDQHAIAGNDHNPSFVECRAEFFANLIKLTHHVFDLLFAENELFAVARAMPESKLNSGLADTSLIDARSVVMRFGHSLVEDMP